MKIELVDVANVRADESNPRTPDEFRLNLVRLSLSKLGWVLPMVTDGSGMILSGHQRFGRALELGFKKVPIIRLDVTNVAAIQRLNLTCNRATNDMVRHESSFTIKESLIASLPRIEEFAAGVPDVDVTSEAAFPCVFSSKSWSVADLVAKNGGLFHNHLLDSARSLKKNKLEFPIVTTSSGAVVNGIGRLELAAVNERDVVDCVVIPDAMHDFARDLLNLVTMDFNVQDAYKDVLRYNSFRRNLGTKPCLGVAFTVKMTKAGLKSGDSAIDETTDPESAMASAWRKMHGMRVIDFGAGKRQDVGILKRIGVDAVPFEPYPLKEASDLIDVDLSRELAREFLRELEKGGFDHVFTNSILNSVPYVEDRRHVVRILSALCAKGASLIATAVSVNSARFRRADGTSGTVQNGTTFRIDYEPNMTMNLGTLPKVQKFHEPAEFYDLFRECFRYVNVYSQGELVVADCKRPEPVDFDLLRKALEFEFDLPYPDGSRMGLAEEAVKSFGKFLNG